MRWLVVVNFSVVEAWLTNGGAALAAPAAPAPAALLIGAEVPLYIHWVGGSEPT